MIGPDKLWSPLFEETRVPTAAVNAGTFVDENGNPATVLGAKVLGIASPQTGDLNAADITAGKEISVIVAGTAPLLMGATTGTKGTELACSAASVGVAAVAGNYVVAIAEEDWTANAVIRVRRIGQYKI